MSDEPSWRLGAFATTAGLAVFAWGLATGAGPATLGARVLAWPRSSEQTFGSYAVQLVAVDGATEDVQAHVHVLCKSIDRPAEDDEPLDTDESGYLLFSESATLTRRTCTTPLGSVSFEAGKPPVGAETLAAPARASTTGVGLRGPAPEVFFEDPELAIDSPTLVWLRIASERAQDLKLDPEPGLEGRVIGPCDGGFVLELRASYHVTGLHLEWGPLTQRERLDVVTPVSRGGPALRVSHDSNGLQYAHISEPGGWMALFDEHGLISSINAPRDPWPLPRLGRDERATLVGTRGSFFDSASTRIRVQPDTDTCRRARALERPWPAPQPAALLDDGVARVHAMQRQRTARGKRTAAFGLAGGLIGLAATLAFARSSRTAGRALAAFAITLTLFGVLAMLLYAS